MGKPYLSEITQLTSTYAWSMQCNIKELSAIIERLSVNSLIAIGSGGSYTVASFHVWLHERATSKLSYAITPYQTFKHTKIFKNTAVTIFSAEGKNKDILGTLNTVIEAEANELVVFTLKEDCPLVDASNLSDWVTSVAFDMPWEKDGYLATNSLFASCLILYRAYQACFPLVFEALPDNLNALIDASNSEFSKNLKIYKLNSNAPHNALLVVFGENGRIASIDCESKMAESALAFTQIADFRNFAHGRHLWADRNQNNAVTLIIWSEEDKALYENYVANLPTAIPRLSMHLTGPEGWQVLAGIWGVLKLVETLGGLKGVDPGEPEVSDFGRSFYMVNAFPEASSKSEIACSEVAISRKFGALNQISAEHKEELENEYKSFKNGLLSADFSHLILDYDATLCSSDTRYQGMTEKIYTLLIKLLEQNVHLGIATGRGKSVLKNFKDVIPEHLWTRISVGLYNGSVILGLDETYSKEKQPQNPLILQFNNELMRNKFIRMVLQSDLGPSQLVLSAIDKTACELAWRVVNELLATPKFTGLKAVRSTHSWDVVNISTSKVNLVEHMREKGAYPLCIGDRGLWPGNDFELLRTPYSLGVDEVSPLSEYCWNIAPLGMKNIAATIFYLNQLEVANGYFKFLI